MLYCSVVLFGCFIRTIGMIMMMEVVVVAGRTRKYELFILLSKFRTRGRGEMDKRLKEGSGLATSTTHQ